MTDQLVISNTTWLRHAIQLSLKVGVTTHIEALKNEPKLTDPRFRKLIEGIYFSRKLILTYHTVILGVVLLVSALHWSHFTLRWWKQRALGSKQGKRYDQNATITRIEDKQTTISYPKETSSSGSSTFGSGGASSPPQEDTPLLRGRYDSPRTPRSERSFSSMKAFLMYQPRPIPFFNKTLPSNGSSLFIGAFIALNIFYTLFYINFNLLELFVFADRCGMIFVANLPLLYVLAAKTQPLKILTGYSYESLNIYHRRLGEVMCAVALLHGIGIVGVWYTLLRPSGFGFIKFLTEKVIILGVFALLAYELLYLTSLASFRQRWYELFLGLHIFLQVSGLVMVFFHHSGSQFYVAAALAIFLVDRLIYRLCLKSTTVEATTKIMEDGDTIKLSAQILVRPSSSTLLNGSLKVGWEANDHVFLTIRSLGRKHWFQAHPFTIASPAPTAASGEASLDLIIRARDGFSADLLRKSRTHRKFTVQLDGPYGSSHTKLMLEDSKLAIVVAGGSGIAVAWPILHHLLHISQPKDVEITPRSIRRQRVVFLWIVHQESHMSWIGQEALAEMKVRGVEVVIPGATESTGRPDLKSLLQEIVQSVDAAEKISVVASGPDGMNRTVRNTCFGLVRDGRDVSITIEKFGW